MTCLHKFMNLIILCLRLLICLTAHLLLILMGRGKIGSHTAGEGLITWLPLSMISTCYVTLVVLEIVQFAFPGNGPS